MRVLSPNARGALASTNVSLDLARTLVLTEVVPWGSVASALFLSTTKGIPFTRALLDGQSITLDRLEEELARADAPTVDDVTADPALLERLPRGLCRRLFAVPLKQGETGAVDVAFADVRDHHAIRELEHHLRAPVRAVRASFARVEEVVSRLPQARREEAVIETTLVSVRAPQMPENASKAKNAIFAPAPEQPPENPHPSSPPLPLVRRASDRPIPLVRRAEEQPVLELRAPYSRQSMRPSIRPSFRPVESGAGAAMRTAQGRDEILHLLLEGASEFARRVILFAVRKDAITGLMCTPTMGDEARIRELRIAGDEPSIFANVAHAGTYLGPLYKIEIHKPVIALLPGVSDTVAVAAVRLRNRPLVLVLAEGMKNAAMDVRVLEDLSRTAGEAFARILASKGE